MAVIDEIPGLQATVRVNGQDLEEYDDPHPDETKNEAQFLAEVNTGNRSVSVNVKHIPIVRKYIEAKSGANFSMEFIKHPTFQQKCHHIGVAFKVDDILTTITHEPQRLKRRRWEYTFSEISTLVSATKQFSQPLLFGDINIDNSSDCTVEKIRQDMVKAKTLGTLRVYVYEMKDTQEIRKIEYETEICDTGETEIAEKATKGRNLTNSVRFGEPVESKPVANEPEDVFVDPEERPFAIFEFIYMSKEGLIREGILPESLPTDDMSLDELRSWAREQLLKERDRPAKDEKSSTITKKENQMSQGGRKRGSGDAETPTPKRYKESRRDDGKVEISLLD
ncbi:hypothetical protein F4775DRAFT_589373 [Biscogniauxia sp. FL1348]|nr:hypothetical protein F4775DRAFT_589373 [Biscogniauxia sp. FL1348]